MKKSDAQVRDFTSKIVFASKELTAKERIMLKDTSDARKIDEELESADALLINPDWYAQLEVHNEKSKMKDKDYTQYIIVDKDGTRYLTGSESFWKQFRDILDEIEEAEEAGEKIDWSLKAFRKESSNFEGKYFITCSII